MEPETRRIEVAGRAFAVDRVRSGPPVVLVHGFPFDRRMWSAVAARLPGRDVIAPDLRGFGDSDPLTGDERPTIDSLGDDVVAVVDALFGSETAFDLGGLSMGGYVALSVVSRYGSRVRRLVLSNTKADADTPDAAAARRRVADETLRDGTGPLASTMSAKVLGETTRSTRPETVEFVRRMIRDCRPETVAAAQHAMADRPDRLPDLGRIRCPTLCVAGDEDVVTPATVLQDIAAAVSDGRAVTIERAGHLAPVEQPEAFADALDAFLSEA